jgi:hypothetical protein
MAKVSEEEIRSLIASGNFDAQWYVNEYPDVAMTGMRPEEHYLWIGRALYRKANPKSLSALSWSPLSWCVMTTPHTLFLANMIASNLRRHGWAVDVVTEAPESFHHDYYIVLCAQMFERLPPGERRICYQLEQSVSSRWFNAEYFHTLENSLAVLDYSLNNIEYLAKKSIAYPHIFYLPIGARDDQKLSIAREKRYDILFYGDYKSSPRRRRFLDRLDGKYNLKIVDEVFGDEILEIIRQSKFVLNIHYYEGALLETPRIQECISLGTPVISEATGDSTDYPYLDDAVTYFEEGSVEDMERVVASALAGRQDGETVKASAATSQRNFEFMFDRFLVAREFLPAHKVEAIELPNVFDARMVGLSLPETVARRRIFEAENIKDCVIFDGMRKSPGWIGCGMSYKSLCAGALKKGKKQLIVVEDDVLLDEEFERKFAIVSRYLDEINGEWDIFSGVIASLHDDTRVIDVVNFEGIDFMTIDKMTSMVFNIYNRRAMQLIADWSPINNHVDSNAIDRYLEHADLRVVVAHPFIAGHREEVHSTLWGFQNTQYVDMIQESQGRLGCLKNEWRASSEVPAAEALPRKFAAFG